VAKNHNHLLPNSHKVFQLSTVNTLWGQKCFSFQRLTLPTGTYNQSFFQRSNWIPYSCMDFAKLNT
jgi:hypothetical protein